MARPGKIDLMDKSVNPQSQLFADTAIAEDNRASDERAAKVREKNEKVATDIATRTEEGKALTRSQKKQVDSNSAIRMLVKKEFRDRKLDTHKMYVDVIEDSYNIAMGNKKTSTYKTDASGNVHIIEGIPVREDIKLKHKRVVLNELEGLEGIHATADDKKRPDTNINLYVDEGLHLKIEDSDGNKTEISSVRTSEGTPSPEAHSENSDSGVWEKGG